MQRLCEQRPHNQTLNKTIIGKFVKVLTGSINPGAHSNNVNLTSPTIEGSSRVNILASNPCKRTHQNVLAKLVQSEGSTSKRVRPSTPRDGNRRVTTVTHCSRVSLEGPVVNASGFGEELAVVTHSSSIFL
nr:hypothetical protein [Tanacetum cinerariifolium]